MTLQPEPLLTVETPLPRTPRLGFAGVGWIGRNRLQAIATSGLAEIAAIADSAAGAIAETRP
ncbi:MAG TPA: hypothetical protein VEA63_02345, partial [Opitutus sp.]|nr:hypothetical protein [Opitutus sp.]